MGEPGLGFPAFGEVLSVPAGALVGGVHMFPLRVYYEDTDAAGFVYFANYLKFAERARTDMLRLVGLEHGDLWNREGVGFAVVQCEAKFLAPGRLDDRVEVLTRLVELGGATLIAAQVVRRERTDLVRMRTRIACVERRGRPKRLPAAVRRTLEPLCQAEPQS